MSFKLIIMLIVGAILAYFYGLSYMTREHNLKAEHQRNFDPCPNTPNCVSSLAQDNEHSIPPFPLLEAGNTQSWQQLIQTIQQNGGAVLVDDGQYAHAVFTSTIFRYKDDLEIMLSADRIDIRSASRAGKSDLGQNRKRVEILRKEYLK